MFGVITTGPDDSFSSVEVREGGWGGREVPEVTEREAAGETGGDDKERQQEALQR